MRISDWSSDVCSSVRCRRGEVVTLIGASGSGKSTFLRCMNMLETPQSGRLRVAEHGFEFGSNHRPPNDAALALLRRDVGMVFQHFNLFQFGRASCRERVCTYV